MAYNSGYNPDALPAHAEPEQAAQILSSQQLQQQQVPQTRKYSNPPPHPHANLNSPHPYPQTQPQYSNKPQPPLPPQPQSLQPHPHSRPSPNANTYSQAPLPPHPPTPSYIYGHSPPPPQNHGHRPSPPANHGRPLPASRPPGTPAPRDRSNSSADASLFPLFKAVDAHGTGQLTERELGKALVNGDFTSFDSHTVKMMIRMFDADKSGSINFDEFCGLWGFLAAWRALFDRFDADKSGAISFAEYTDALIAFGYKLSPNFVNLLYTTYDKSGEGAMSFDLFVQSCIILKRMTDVFKKYDEDRDGYITLSFEEFLTEILRQR